MRAISELGLIAGIKVDTGAKALAGHPREQVTEGLDGLRARLAEYSQMGARFAKWRAVLTIGDGTPSRGCIEANALTLARYASLCQEANLSGGQPSKLATARLNAMHVRFASRLPWALTFSFARALQEPALEIWRGENANVPAAQRAVAHRAACDRAACRGKYSAELEGATA